MIRHLIFDFFGTLAEYNDGPAGNGCVASLGVLRRLGVCLDEDAFLSRWQAVFGDLETDAQRDLSEYSMRDAGRRFFAQSGIDGRPRDVDDFVSAYVADWNDSVTLLPRLDAWLDALPFGKSVLSNTHDVDLVPNHLAQGGVLDRFECVTLSVNEGIRKPHPDLYARHLTALALAPRDAVFVGDNAACDYFGPRNAGMRAFLIAPRPVPGVDEAERLTHLFQLIERLD